MIAIEARELRKTFPVRRGEPVEAVAGISFAVEAGERLAYIGPNGAGKSTSIKMLTGILHPTSGDAAVLGIVPWKKRRELAARIGTLFGQRSQLWYQLTPRQTFGLLGRIYRIPVDEERRRLAPHLLQLGRHHATVNIGRATRRERNDDSHRPVGIRLRQREERSEKNDQ